MFFKVSFFSSLLNQYMKTWYSHGQYKANGLGTNKICYIFDLRHMSNVAAQFQNVHIFIQVYKQRESGKSKILKSKAPET